MPLRRILNTIIATVAATFQSAGQASAQTSGDVQFNGLIFDICIVAILGSGTLAPDATYTSLSSENPGGARGGATVVTTSTNFDLTIDAPAGFSMMPVGGDIGVSFNALVSATGVTALTDILDGALSSLGLGLTTLSIGATATKGAGIFPAGSYQLPVTVRCVAS
ncbi:hypothetical protein [Hyphococcus sp.]|uniref:hypothetical protein n=1 Tax=Hyphococcus sp. TaxID=2038636 RepID=UPI00208B08F8|nr:MAG: hypothetical protein DHS20C04_01420 [Marinicaulis sp.]